MIVGVCCFVYISKRAGKGKKVTGKAEDSRGLALALTSDQPYEYEYDESEEFVKATTRQPRKPLHDPV